MRFLAYPSFPLLSEAVADQVVGALGLALAEDRDPLLAVAGGRTPALYLPALFARGLDWARVTVMPTDERWVPLDHPASNESALRALMATTPAAAARVVGLYTGCASPGAGLDAATARMGSLSLPPDATLLGMGEDGHVASVFPGSPEPDGDDAPLVAVPAAMPAPAEPRMSLTLPLLAASRCLCLVTAGIAKRRILEDGNPALPVHRLSRMAGDDLHVHWTAAE